ncbi:hyoscyamine 6-dioxygenase-like isoform X2 [Salvia hispanica]|uniref:hyoscyamine 6-dioxygenase-like isoform X2 n=1 Tax=Salvia hispanica TaxID=49212 RepID=UPI0020090AFC|nr:hyoscyamine 6-dioxygenase-like isoform X2 [Salvia hispanica]
MSMESKWYNVESVPESHIFLMEDRAGNEAIPICHTIPIIDLANSKTLDKIMQASKEYGFFQVTNHGVAEDVIGEAVHVLEELFQLESEEISKDANTNGWVYMGSTSFSVKGAHLWRDNIKHPCHPLEESVQHWSHNPTRYRQVVARYIEGIRRVSLRILEVICQGLGLEKGYLGDMSQVQFLTASHYPACPDPTLTLGLLPHLDHSFITLLYQGNVGGLQVMLNGKWMGVEYVPNAFVVNIGTQIQQWEANKCGA